MADLIGVIGFLEHQPDFVFFQISLLLIQKLAQPKRMEIIPGIKISDFNYNLPQDKIAQYPLAKRDESKLLIYGNHHIQEDRFYHLASHLPSNSLMVYNETRVIQARLQFLKNSGALIEIFCLEPVEPTKELQQAFEQKSGVVWKCLIGNSKKWKQGEVATSFSLKGNEVRLKAIREDKSDGHSRIRFEWDPNHFSFSEILQQVGLTPLPPYMNRPSEDDDKTRYQTIYARSEGSVAAPTAGLHFTDQVLESLKKKNISTEKVTLHVGAGTFKPVSAEDIGRHEMHAEKIIITKHAIQRILNRLNETIILVGTTTVRTMESLYWHGVKLITEDHPETEINIKQWDPYKPEYKKEIPVSAALEKILDMMENKHLDVLTGQTQLMIVPGYRFRIADIIITNFHMPKSTLLLLVSAFIGEAWKEVYAHALENDFRFLSYGDSCLFFKQE